jgi:hypothetical protein
MPGIDSEMAGIKTNLSHGDSSAKQHLSDDRATLRPDAKRCEVGR